MLLVQEGTRTGHRSLEETPIDVMGLRLTSSEKATVLCVGMFHGRWGKWEDEVMAGVDSRSKEMVT